MARENFTRPKIIAFTCPPDKAQAFIWDSGSPGLGLRVTKNGAKAFIFQGKIKGGSEARITIGDPAIWQLPEAREKARQYAMMADSGQDPRQVLADQAAAEQAQREVQLALELKQSLTARTVWDIYLAAPHKKWGEQHRKDHLIAANEGGEACKIGRRAAKAGPLASLLCKPLSEITASVVHDWLNQESKARATFTFNAYRKFRTFISWCSSHPIYGEIVRADCCSASTVKDSLPSKRTKEGDCLQRDQLGHWFKAMLALHNQVLSAYFQTLLITGARRNEIASLRWKDIDFEWRKMTVRDKVEVNRHEFPRHP